LRGNGANGLITDLQKKPPAVSRVPLAHADERLSAKWMERMRHAHKECRSDRRVCILNRGTTSYFQEPFKLGPVPHMVHLPRAIKLHRQNTSLDQGVASWDGAMPRPHM
jgi:hypothetical protein